jgi:zinc protease
MLQTVYLYFTQPRNDPETFDALRQRWAAVLVNRAASPEQAFSDTLNLILTQHHPRAQPLTSGALEEVQLQPAYEFFRRCFSDAKGFTFVFVGSLDPQQVEGAIVKWIGGLPELPEHEGWQDLGIRPPQKVVTRTVHKGEEPKSRTAIVFSGDFEWNRGNRHAISCLAQVLEIRLRDLIREKLSGTYEVRVSAYPGLYPVPSYSVNIMFGCDPTRLDELSNEVFAAIAKLKTVAPSEEEVAKLKEQQRRQLEVDLRINRKWLNWIEFRDRYRIDQREQLSSEKLIDSLDAETLQSAARRYLDLKRYVQVSLLPED